MISNNIILPISIDLLEETPSINHIFDNVIGVDIGIDYTKTSTGCMFRSTSLKVKEHPEISINKSNIIYKGNKYVVGNSYGDVTLKSNNCTTEDYKICLLTALALSYDYTNPNLNEIDINLAIGLPAEYYEELSCELSSEIKKIQHQTISFQDYNDKWKTTIINILDFRIFKQGATYCNEYKIYFKYPLLLLDFGSQTLNISLWQSNEDIINPYKIRTYNELGFYDIMHEFVIKFDCIRGSYGHFSTPDVIDIFEGEWPVDPKILKEVKDKVLKPYVSKLSHILKGFDVNLCNDVRLLGAPATILFDYINAKYPVTNSTLPGDINPKFANAILFKKSYQEFLIIESEQSLIKE
jgi:hypothetical protein